MFKVSLILVLLFLLAGCVTTTHYGNYVEDNSETHNSIIASDAAYQLMQIYPPASTKLNMLHVAEDSFGTALIKSLRTGGYAIQEHKTSSLGQPENTATADNSGAALAYIFDQSSDVYRLSVMIDKKILTRAYMPHENKVVPAGSWVLKE